MSMGRSRSIRQRLVLGLALPLILVLGLALWLNHQAALALADQAFDKALLNAAVALSARLELDSDSDLDVDLPSSAQAVLQTDAIDRMFFAVVDPGQRLVWGEDWLNGCVNTALAVEPQAESLHCHGQWLRVLRLDRQGPLSRARVLVAETTHKREQAAAQILRNSAALGLALGLAALLTVFLVTQRVLAPLEALARRLDQNHGEPLQALDIAAELPSELQSLVRALNGLLARLNEQAGAQQAFISDVAHQLRTPLANLALQLQLQARDAAAPGSAASLRRQSLMEAALQRMQRMVAQVLSLAMASNDASAGESLSRLDLRGLAESCASEFIDAARARGIDLGFELAEAWVQGRAEALHELVSNLLDNALVHGRQGGTVTVRTGVLRTEAFFEVEDDGPGIAAPLREQLFKRHGRGPASSGSGLGLAIVQRIARQHGGHIELVHGEPGTTARLLLPLA
ncbi:sensor histidine kinase [Paucibacter sp. APW11]|uniref:histidine kinase n=1 Tax=Roseateles aquae TaxID=3077235 RepID=A0ABU3PHG0_9BURK|nr:sensor histidine kinase [Paucibacter sp. APW11]MDT9001999.1 sensor histidine kinase [Paucibacter sp. APW11]